MMKTVAFVAAAALGLAACGSSSNDNTSASSGSAGGGYGSKAATTTKSTVASSSTSGTTEVDMHDNFFQAKTITGKAGSTVKIKLKNQGSNDHNFKIDSQLKQADADVKPGTTATVSVTIPKSGTLQFYCEYHKGLGMVGTVKPS